MTLDELFGSVCAACSERDRPFITSNISKDGKSLSVYFYRQLAMRFMIGKKVSHVELDANYIKEPTEIASEYKMIGAEAGGKVRLYLNRDFNYAAFSAVVQKICTDCKEWAPVNLFGCCSLYVECSDEKECLRWRDEEYLGCSYRRNLEAGRIFYGHCRHIDGFDRTERKSGREAIAPPDSF